MTGAGVLVGLLAGAAIALGAGPRRRAAARATRLAGADPGQAGSGAGGSPESRRPRWTLRLPGRGRDPVEDGRLPAALVEVASLLRAGVTPADAWSLVLGTPVPDRVPTVAQLAAVAGGDRAARRAGGSRGGGGSARRSRGSPGAPLAAVVAAARMADELGAPLAGVLDQVAAAIAAQAEADADVEAALAGPRSSARVLAWLPLLGLVLGTALGANPVRVLLGGGLGSAAGALGALLVLVGRRWSGALLRRAARAGGAA